MDEWKAKRFLEEMEDRWGHIKHDEGNAELFCPEGKEALGWQIESTLCQMDWASPHLWAPFTLMGYGGFRFDV